MFSLVCHLFIAWCTGIWEEGTENSFGLGGDEGKIWRNWRSDGSGTRAGWTFWAGGFRGTESARDCRFDGELTILKVLIFS